MKKNSFKDDNMKKGSKGFYAALGISAVMIGSACFFAYNQGEKISNSKLPANNNISASDAAVDNKYSDIPKTTSPAYKVTTTAPVTTAKPVTTAAATAAPPPATLPAAEIVEDVPANSHDNEYTAGAENDPNVTVNTNTTKLENVRQPLEKIDVLTSFSGGELVKNETTGSWQTHNGTDYLAEVGTEVYAVSPGEVVEIRNDPLWGVTVTVNHHNGYITRYCGLGSDLSVQEGDTVVSGDVIGAVGETADIESSSAPHLHMEITHNGSYVDPVSVLK